MIWHPHTEKPDQLKTILIARKNLCGDGYHLQYGIFVINKKGQLINEKTLVRQSHLTEYFWVYESEVVENLNI